MPAPLSDVAPTPTARPAALAPSAARHRLGDAIVLSEDVLQRVFPGHPRRLPAGWAQTTKPWQLRRLADDAAIAAAIAASADILPSSTGEGDNGQQPTATATAPPPPFSHAAALRAAQHDTDLAYDDVWLGVCVGPGHPVVVLKAMWIQPPSPPAAAAAREEAALPTWLLPTATATALHLVPLAQLRQTRGACPLCHPDPAPPRDTHHPGAPCGQDRRADAIARDPPVQHDCAWCPAACGVLPACHPAAAAVGVRLVGPLAGPYASPAALARLQTMPAAQIAAAPALGRAHAAVHAAARDLWAPLRAGLAARPLVANTWTAVLAPAATLVVAVEFVHADRWPLVDAGLGADDADASADVTDTDADADAGARVHEAAAAVSVRTSAEPMRYVDAWAPRIHVAQQKQLQALMASRWTSPSRAEAPAAALIDALVVGPEGSGRRTLCRQALRAACPWSLARTAVYDVHIQRDGADAVHTAFYDAVCHAPAILTIAGLDRLAPPQQDWLLSELLERARRLAPYAAADPQARPFIVLIMATAPPQAGLAQPPQRGDADADADAAEPLLADGDSDRLGFSPMALQLLATVPRLALSAATTTDRALLLASHLPQLHPFARACIRHAREFDAPTVSGISDACTALAARLQDMSLAATTRFLYMLDASAKYRTPSDPAAASSPAAREAAIAHALQGATPAASAASAVSSAARALQPRSRASRPVPFYGQSDALDRTLEWLLFPFTRPEAFARLGAAPARGILLHGPTGAGKSHLIRHLLSRADVAAASPRRAGDRAGPRVDAASTPCAGYRFLRLALRDVMRPYLGESEAYLRAAFRRARAASPCILVIEQIELLAASRGRGDGDGDGDGGDGTSASVNERLLSTLLNEMDGLEPASRPVEPGADAAATHVVVLATTTQPWAIDAALLRPGRLAHHVRLSAPDATQRAALLAAYAAQHARSLLPPAASLEMHAAVRAAIADPDWIAATASWTPADLLALVAHVADRVAAQRAAAVAAAAPPAADPAAAAAAAVHAATTWVLSRARSAAFSLDSDPSAATTGEAADDDEEAYEDVGGAASDAAADAENEGPAAGADASDDALDGWPEWRPAMAPYALYERWTASLH